ncbi:serine hydrolase domain-containing protein [Zobellia nedashkovskayae]
MSLKNTFYIKEILLKTLTGLIAIGLLLTLSSCIKENIVVPADLTSNPKSSDIDIKVDDIFNSHRENINTIGLSIGILKNGETHFYGYGEIKKGSNIIPNENTFFEIGSITKTFTSILATDMLLNDNLDIETTLKSYLPSNLPTLNRNGTEVNFKHLLSHTAGFPTMPSNFTAKPFSDASNAWEKYDDRRLFSFLDNLLLRSDPFTEFLYSNAGLAVVGATIEQNYNQEYGEVLQNKLLMPLDLMNTSAYFKETEEWTTGYSFTGEETGYFKSLNALDAAGVIKSTPQDLLKYAEANINIPETSLGEAIRLTHEVQFMEYEVNDFYKIRSCLGWFEYINNTLPEETFIWHNGATGGYNSELFINLEHQSALVLLFNKRTLDNSDRELFIAEMLQLLLE